MFDLEKDVTHTILLKLQELKLAPGLYFLFLFIFKNHRFSIKFCRKFCQLVDWVHARSKFTPSLPGDEGKERKK